KPDYTVLDGLESKQKRLYNYPWVAQLYLEMYRLTQERNYLVDSYRTLSKYFLDSKYGFYAIGVPAQSLLNELRTVGLVLEHDSLLAQCRQTADQFVKTGLYYPKSEVNYEQSIVAPSVVFLFEMYQITKDEKYLREGERQLKALESFGGQQPDYHLNEIAIRHWDGYWFGKRQFWGDIMPHYWSTITSEASMRYAQITGNDMYKERAVTIVRNNLCLFFNDGSASCAYVYPANINGKKAAFFDPFANDQDWALVYYLKTLDSYKSK
ncbi:MAG: six-hairpin glycosidase, partial [Bacteroidota bacterium]|nr:six-hairpin glycosidase [Bacteroidota bacterium]